MPKRYKHTSFWICAALAVAGVAGALPRILAPNVDLQTAGFKGLGTALIFALVAFLSHYPAKSVVKRCIFQDLLGHVLREILQ